jgi:hypothetical protein
MGELRRHEAEASTRTPALVREVVPVLSRPSGPAGSSVERRPGMMLGFLAAALMTAAGIDAALWHHNTRCRDLERRAQAAELRGAMLDAQNRSLRDHLSSSQTHARALHDELLERDTSGDLVFIRLSSPAMTGGRTPDVTPAPRAVGQEVLP